VLGYTAGGSLIFYTFTTYMQKYLVNTAGMPAKTASVVMTGCLFLYMCMQPVFGMLADRIGRRHSMLLFGALGTLATFPILAILHVNTSPVVAFVLITVALAIVSLYTSISGLVKAEMFPPEVRALGVGCHTRFPTPSSAARRNSSACRSRTSATKAGSTSTSP
jgi:MHS family alpha-ketoglutarate permease-like MFS transporter